MSDQLETGQMRPGGSLAGASLPQTDDGMSETQPKARPWHGHASPFDALHDWMVRELAALEQRLKHPGIQEPAAPPKVEPPKPAETVAAPHAPSPADA